MDGHLLIAPPGTRFEERELEGVRTCTRTYVPLCLSTVRTGATGLGAVTLIVVEFLSTGPLYMFYSCICIMDLTSSGRFCKVAFL